MKIKLDWLWLVYYLCYVSYAAGNAAAFFSPRSPSFLYYHFLIAYDLRYLVPYCLNVLSVIFTVFTILPLVLRIIKYQVFSAGFWRSMFFARLTFDLIGHSYDYKFVKSLFYQDLYAPLYLLLAVILFLLPSYMAFFIYAFGKK